MALAWGVKPALRRLLRWHGPPAKASRPHPCTSQVFPEGKQGSSPCALQDRGTRRPSRSHRKGGEVWPAARRLWERRLRHCQALLHPPESHGNWAGGRGRAGALTALRSSQWGQGEGPGASEGRLGGGWGEGTAAGSAQTALPLPHPPAPTRFQGQGPPKASFSGHAGGPHPQGPGRGGGWEVASPFPADPIAATPGLISLSLPPHLAARLRLHSIPNTQRQATHPAGAW